MPLSVRLTIEVLHIVFPTPCFSIVKPRYHNANLVECDNVIEASVVSELH